MKRMTGALALTASMAFMVPSVSAEVTYDDLIADPYLMMNIEYDLMGNSPESVLANLPNNIHGGEDTIAAGALERYLREKFPGTFYDEIMALLQEELKEITKDQITKQAVQQQTKKSTKNFKNMVRINKTEEAADFFSNPVVHGSFSYASIHDNQLNGGGKNTTGSLTLTGDLGDSFFAGIDLSKDRYRIGGASNYIQNTHTVTTFLGMSPSERWSFGTFLSYSDIDVELGHILGTAFSEQVARVGGGFLANYNWDLNERVNASVTTTLASVNKKSLDALLDDKDTQASVLLDANIKMSDEISLNPFVGISYLIDTDPGDPDGSFGTPGFDVVWTANESWTVRGGYETVVSDDSRDENRFNFSASYAF